jgi:hypothetical protein
MRVLLVMVLIFLSACDEPAQTSKRVAAPPPKLKTYKPPPQPVQQQTPRPIFCREAGQGLICD